MDLNSVVERMKDRVLGHRVYVSLQCDSRTNSYLRDYCEDHGFNLSMRFDGTYQEPEEFDFHTTIFYTTSRHPNVNEADHGIGTRRARVTGFDLLGENRDIPVLKVDSPYIYGLRSTYESFHGFKDAWPSYTPHISLSYDRDMEYSSKLDIGLPDFDIVYDRVVVQKIVS